MAKNSVQLTIRLLSAYYESGKLNVYSNEEIPDGVLLSIDNGIETLVSELKHDKGNRYSTDIKLAKTQYTCYLVDKDKKSISNKLFVNWTEFLATTNPSKMSRNLNRFISLSNESFF